MANVSTINGVSAANIATIDGVAKASINTINGVEIGFSNVYSLAMGNIQTGAPSLSAATHMQVANPTSYNFHDSETEEDTPFSLSMWFKMPSTTDTPAGVGMNGRYMISKGTSGGGNLEWQVHFHGGSHVLMIKLEDSSGNQMYTYDGTQSWTSLQGSWHHLAVTYGGGPYATLSNRQDLIESIYYYIDGTQYQGTLWAGGWPYSPGGSVTWDGLRTSSNPVKVGSSVSGPTQTMIGYMDEVSIWERALSTSEVGDIYNGGVPTDLSTHSAATDLHSWWRMGDSDGGSGTTVTDVQSTGNGTLCTTLACGTPGVYGSDGFVGVVP